MTEVLSTQDLRELLGAHNRQATNLALDDIHPRDVAEAAEGLTDQELLELLRHLEPPLNGDILSHLPEERQVALAEAADPDAAADLLEAMPSDDRVDLVQQLTAKARSRILAEMEEPERQDVERLAQWPEGTAGAIMSSDFATLRADLTVSEAISRLREMALRKETIYYNYVVDETGRLLGIVSLRDLVLADPATRLEQVMNEDVISVSAEEDQEEVARTFREYDLLALPVVGPERQLLGIVTIDDVLDVAEEEATEELQRFGATALGRVSLREAGVGLLYRRRVGWLMALVVVNLISGAGIALFEETIAGVVALVFFLPLLIGSGGNAGSQAATLMVRALATGDVAAGDWVRMLGKEILVALALGATMAVGVSLISAWRAPEVMTVVALTMVIVVVIGSLLGMLLPFIFTRLNLDAATASGPLITSLADISGVMIYLGLATLLLNGAG